ncbi:hypothetical protein SBW85_07055 [Vibrio plantisponsor]|uniref:Uncharacterized protein n=1 Tax=Vibrio plantisponsor TaxID=664643 RepID=A0ABU4IJS6_9VIBR|nr:hypothetical protein [Vibrio plantisponsor]MDW6017534.1 hypothetical protein [Vibrio plantisponsor]
MLYNSDGKVYSLMKKDPQDIQDHLLTLRCELHPQVCIQGLLSMK